MSSRRARRDDATARGRARVSLRRGMHRRRASTCRIVVPTPDDEGEGTTVRGGDDGGDVASGATDGGDGVAAGATTTGREDMCVRFDSIRFDSMDCDSTVVARTRSMRG